VTPPRALRLLAPAAIGSALVGGVLILRSDSEQALRAWDTSEPQDLSAVARAAISPSPLPLVATLRKLDEAGLASARPAARSAPSRSLRASLAGATSDVALTGSLAAGAKLFERASTPLLPPEALALITDAADPAAAEHLPDLAPRPDQAVPAGWSIPTDEQALSGPSALAQIGSGALRNLPGQALAVTRPAPADRPVAAALPSPVPQSPPAARASRAPALMPVVWSLASPQANPPPTQAGLQQDEPAALASPAHPAIRPPPATGPAAAASPDPLLAGQARPIDLSPGRQTFPASADAPGFSFDDELILQLRVTGITATDTIVAYGTRAGVYLPLGELAQILDLAIRVSDDGHFAGGWFLAEDRSLEIDLRQGMLTTSAGTVALPQGAAQPFEGELYLRTDFIASLLPLDVTADLRAQAVLLTTREPFPFEERMRRDELRAQLGQREGQDPAGEGSSFPREDTPWLALSFPMADVELRGVSDSGKGTRAEGDLSLSGDIAFVTGQAFFSATSRDGLVASLVELGRRDADGDLLGPLGATEFQLGDVATPSMPLGLRGTSGRGAFITNLPLEQASVFDRIDLRGVLPDGYEVELYRNDILLGSTAQAVNGQYEFLEIPVDYGLNVFRLVFYGPQGQRREEVQRISVGDGRLAAGDFTYSFGAVQRGTNLLGVEGPDFRPGLRYGDWQATGEIAYGFIPGLTGVASGALYEAGGEQRWMASAGLRTGIGGLALRGDAGIAEGGGHALGLGTGGRLLGGAFALTHFEYGGGFLDEVHSIDSAAMRRSTEADFNTSLLLGDAQDGALVPISARIRHAEYADGRTRLSAGLRGSARVAGMMVSSTLDYLRNTATGGIGFSQLVGNFDLGTLGRADTQLRGSLGYRILPDLALTQVSANAAHRIDEATLVSGTAAYSIEGKDLSLSLSGARQFERFSLALDGQYAVRQRSYAVALRLGFSLGRDPLRQRLFIDRPGLATSGGAALRAFHDRDGDGSFSDGDLVLPDVGIAVFNNSVTTDAQGMARLGDLGHGNRVTLQIDPGTLPDIAMAPARRGIEIVPRAGRIHTSELAIVELSEIEGTVSFAGTQASRGVSGLRLQLRDSAGDVADTVRTERGGYYFFEQVRPGSYEIVIDPAQAVRLDICLAAPLLIEVAALGDVLSRDIAVASCTAGQVS
jgi:hypothetical protein